LDQTSQTKKKHFWENYLYLGLIGAGLLVVIIIVIIACVVSHKKKKAKLSDLEDSDEMMLKF